jgi:hypothetical protein
VASATDFGAGGCLMQGFRRGTSWRGGYAA